jgi:FkbM family methyltransferase
MQGMRLAVSVHISHAHIRGVSELSTLTALDKLVQPNHICYDLGASIGYMSLLMARTARHVFAFEPAPHAAREIRRNATANGLSNVTIIPTPVSDTVAAVEFAITDVAYGSAISRGQSNWPTLKLTTTTLDNFILDHPAPDLVKIDVENEEGRVIQGATRLLSTKRPVICCELHSTPVARTVVDILIDHGYEVTTLSGEPFRVSDDIVPGEVQVIARPSGTT